MCIKKAVVKLAAAAVVVAGGAVVGTAWAQLSSVVGAASVSQKEMTATFTVGGVSELEVVARDPDADVLLATDVTAKTPGNGIDPGTLGLVKVKTNSNAWDVVMRTLHGGRLVNATDDSDGDPVCKDDAWDPFDATVCLTEMVPGDPVRGQVQSTLVYSTKQGGTASQRGRIRSSASTDFDTVQLEVSIGMAKAGEEISAASQSAQGNIYALGGPTGTNIIAPVLIPFGTLNDSRTLELNNAPFTSSVGISFAAVLGAGGSAGATDGYATKTNGTAYLKQSKNGSDGRTWTEIATAGFGKPSRTEPIDGGKTVGVEYFFINVGLEPTLVPSIGNNAKATYKETFIFDLVSAF